MLANVTFRDYGQNSITRRDGIKSPRNVYSFLNKLANDKAFYISFQNSPIHIFEEYGFDISKIVIPNDFKLPSQSEIKERLIYINTYEDFVSPSQIQSLPILPVVFVFIPILTN